MKMIYTKLKILMNYILTSALFKSTNRITFDFIWWIDHLYKKIAQNNFKIESKRY